jgi:hypothetical protein
MYFDLSPVQMTPGSVKKEPPRRLKVREAKNRMVSSFKSK